MAYHYVESGLDNIYLEGGVTVHETPYGKGVSIADTDGLHRVIGGWLVSLRKPLIGAEFRFLRIQMDMTQKALADFIGTTEQTLRLWEKHRNKSVPGPADRLLRLLYTEYSDGDGSVRKMVEKLAELDRKMKPRASFTETKKGWELADCNA